MAADLLIGLTQPLLRRPFRESDGEGMSIVFHICATAKKRVSRGQFFGSASGKVLVSLAAVCVVGAVALLCSSSLLLTDSFMHEQLGIAKREIADMRQGLSLFGPILLLVCAFLLVACGYRQVTADTAMRRRETLYIDDAGRLVCSFKLSNDARPHGMNVVSIGLASCNVSVKNEIAMFSGDAQGAYITDWHEGAVVPLDKLGPMTKPFKLGLYFEPDLLETIRPLAKSVDER